jgi:hypothetical protein
MDTKQAELVTRRHIARVSELLGEAACELICRGAAHDRSKLTEEEMQPLARLQEVIDREGQAAYGSEEYKRRTAMLGPMTAHHYAHNSHHPEHYPAGIDGMNLFDVLEMFLDWKAASERGEEGTIGLSHSAERFGIEPQLLNILLNTAAYLGYETS